MQHGTAIQRRVYSLIAGTYDASTLRRRTLRTACLQSESAAPEAGTEAGHQDACAPKRRPLDSSSGYTSTSALSTAARRPSASPLTIYQLPWRLWAAPTGTTATVAVLAAPTGNTLRPCSSLIISAADR